MNYGDKSDKVSETDVLVVEFAEVSSQLSSKEPNQLADVLDMTTASQMADVLLADDRLLSKLVGS